MLKQSDSATRRHPGRPVDAPRAGRSVATGIAIALVWIGSAAAIDRGADGHFEERTSSHFVLLQDVDIDETAGLRGSRRFEQVTLDELERAYESLDDLLGLRPPRRIKVVIYDPRVFDSQFRGLFRFPAAGFYAGVIRVRGDVQMSVALSRVLHHELVHAALHMANPSFGYPAWLNEGLAEWFEARAHGKRQLGPREAAALSRAAANGRLFSLHQLTVPSFAHLAGGDAQAAYLQSYGFVSFLARRHGESTLARLVDDLWRSRNVERSVRKIFRADLSALEGRFIAEIR